MLLFMSNFWGAHQYRPLAQREHREKEPEEGRTCGYLAALGGEAACLSQPGEPSGRGGTDQVSLDDRLAVEDFETVSAARCTSAPAPLETVGGVFLDGFLGCRQG